MSVAVSFTQFCQHYELAPTTEAAVQEYQAYLNNLHLMGNAFAEEEQGKQMEEQDQFENVTIDLETLDTKSTSKILSIGIVPFNWNEQPTFDELCNRKGSLYIKVKMDTVPDVFTQSDSTVKWWEQQGKEARHVLAPSEDDMDFKAALLLIELHLRTWAQPLKKDGGQVFCRGYDFDGGILNHAFEAMDIKKPWGYNRFRCIRTVIDTLAGTRNGKAMEGEPESFTKHHALHDAAKDTLTMLTLAAERM